MSNYHPENGGIDPRFTKINPVGGLHEQIVDQSPVSNGTGQVREYSLVCDLEVPDYTPGGNFYETPGQSSIINETMSDSQGEVTNIVPAEVLQDPIVETDGEVLGRVKKDFEAIADTGYGEGMNEAHGVVLENLYPPLLINTLEELLTSTQLTGNPKANAEVRAAIQAVDQSLNNVRALSEGRSMYSAFRRADNLYSKGPGKLVSEMTAARDQAIACLEQYHETITDPSALKQAIDIYSSYLERRDGVKLPKSFVEKLFDPNTKVLAIQLDFNSTLNTKESYSNPPINKLAQDAIEMLVETFEQKFPDKSISIAINTGRPPQYAWGVHEASMIALPQVRKFAFAESGGVILTNLESGAMEVAVESPQEWQHELQGIRSHITGLLANPKDLMIEKKESMLSIKIAEPGSSDFILKAKDGRPVDNEWIREQMQQYFLDAQMTLGLEDIEIREDLINKYPQTKEFIEQNLNGNSDRTHRAEALKTLEELFEIAGTDHVQKLREIDARLDMINMMHREGLLQSKYNPTAGYVDVAHANLNKFSTSMKKICKEFGVTPDQVLWVIVGDSTTDIVPTNLTGPGEPNEEAHKAFMVAVRKRNKNMDNALKERGDHGIDTENDSTNAVAAFALGVENVINPPKKVNSQ